MTHPAPPTPLERIAIFVRLLTQAVVTRNLYFQVLATVRANWVLARLRTLREKFQRLAERIAAGTYRPRAPVSRRKPQTPRAPRAPANHVVPRQRGWLGQELPGASQYRAMLRDLLNDPETQKLIQVAPAEMARLLRPVCWMLGYKPPTILPAPKRPAPSRPAGRPRGPTQAPPRRPRPAAGVAPPPPHAKKA